MYLTLNFKIFNSEEIVKYLSKEVVKDLEKNQEKKFFSLTAPDKKNPEKHGFYELPEYTTYGFRQILRRVFCNGFYWKDPGINLVIKNTEFKIDSLSFFISTKEELDQMEKDDLMIVISFSEIDKGSDTKIFNMGTVKTLANNFNKKDKDKDANKFFTNVLGFKLNKVFDKVDTEKYDIKYIDTIYNKDYDRTYSTICSFYYYAFILQYRLERQQVEADVSGENFNENLIIQKTFLLNLNRFFLTTNRSEKTEIKEFSNKVKDQFDLVRKIKLRSENIQLFEELVLRKISAIDNHRSKILNRAMTVVTFFGIPLVLISTLMDLDPTAKVVTETIATIDALTWIFILSIFPLIVIGLLQVGHKLFSKNPGI